MTFEWWYRLALLFVASLGVVSSWWSLESAAAVVLMYVIGSVAWEVLRLTVRRLTEWAERAATEERS